MIKNLKMAQIVRNENQPRKFFDADKLQELADSIRLYGLLQPIVVRKTATNTYEIVAGERRWRAHQILDNITIQAKIIDEPNPERAFEQALQENITRADMLPLEEAFAFQCVLDNNPGEDEGWLARRVKKSVQYVKQRLALLDLAPEVAEQVNAGNIGTQAAVQMSTLTVGNQRAVLGKWARGDFSGDNQLVHFAFALRQQQDQEVCMIVEGMTDEEREERTKMQAKTRNYLDGIERIRGFLDQIIKTDSAALAIALEGEVGSRLEQMDRVADAVQKARFALRQAKAHAEARAIIVNPSAESPAAIDAA